MTGDKLKEYYSDIVQHWQWFKEFLSRTDDQTDPDKYWKDVVTRYEDETRGKSEFVHQMYIVSMKELERIKKCSNEQ